MTVQNYDNLGKGAPKHVWLSQNSVLPPPPWYVVEILKNSALLLHPPKELPSVPHEQS